MRLAPRRRTDRYRDRAIEALQLRPPQRVVDVGCGRGAALESLRAHVGEAGAVIAVDVDPHALERASALIAANDWSNVQTSRGPAAECVLEVHADAALFAYVDELLLDPAPVLNVLRQLRPRARVASVGREPAHFYRDRPWELLSGYLGDFQVVQLGMRGYYLAHGFVLPNESRSG